MALGLRNFFGIYRLLLSFGVKRERQWRAPTKRDRNGNGDYENTKNPRSRRSRRESQTFRSPTESGWLASKPR